jgi:hypothetical protein
MVLSTEDLVRVGNRLVAVLMMADGEIRQYGPVADDEEMRLRLSMLEEIDSAVGHWQELFVNEND